MEFRGFDSNIILSLRVGILRYIGNFPEMLSQQILVGMILLGVMNNVYFTDTRIHMLQGRHQASPCKTTDHACWHILWRLTESSLSPRCCEVMSQERGLRQLLMAHHKWTMAFHPAWHFQHPPIQNLNHLGLSVPKLTLRMVHLRLAITNRPKAAVDAYPFDSCDILVNNAGINIRSKAPHQHFICLPMSWHACYMYTASWAMPANGRTHVHVCMAHVYAMYACISAGTGAHVSHARNFATLLRASPLFCSALLSFVAP